MRVQTISTMAEDGDKHKNNANELLSTRTMAEDDDKHKNNDRRRC